MISDMEKCWSKAEHPNGLGAALTLRHPPRDGALALAVHAQPDRGLADWTKGSEAAATLWALYGRRALTGAIAIN